jgi:hypothetical protein
MLLSLTLVLGVLALAVAEAPFHVDTEDAYATQCRAGICATLQVTRSRFSNGAISTLLFFSAYDERGTPISISSFPSGFTLIPNEHFVMSPQGTQATLNYSGASVAWEATDGGGKAERGGSGRPRVSEREKERRAAVKGTVGPIVFTSAGPRRSGDFGSAYLTVRETAPRTRKK